MTEFITPLVGGLLIGLAATLLLLFLGRIAGISGIVWGAISNQSDRLWRWLFVWGLIIGVGLYHAISGAPIPSYDMGPVAAIIGGLLVGVGVKLGSGCTSGHGVCGLGRLSLRSLAATATFMGLGVVTVSVVRHLL
ncbi:MAG TPA: YeeE/YedE thiosulfate transporter family protein [Marinagarivorans sp.]